VKQYTYSEARQQLASILSRAQREGAVRIRRRDGTTFVLRPETNSGSPLDVSGLTLKLGRKTILAAIREGRRTV
jgi:hypothetical protein